MAKTTTERVAVWLTPEQVAWLKTKENVSVTLRALVNEAMNMQRLADSLKQKEARKAPGTPKPLSGKGEKTKQGNVKAVPATAKPAVVLPPAKGTTPAKPSSAPLKPAKAGAGSAPSRKPKWRK